VIRNSGKTSITELSFIDRRQRQFISENDQLRIEMNHGDAGILVADDHVSQVTRRSPSVPCSISHLIVAFLFCDLSLSLNWIGELQQRKWSQYCLSF
jgi:hypothetical protein